MFENVVELYRLVGKPDLIGGAVYKFSGPVTPDVADKITAYEGIDPKFGSIDVFSNGGGLADIEIKLPFGDHGQFYDDINQFIVQAKSIALGKLPEYYYIVSEDFFSIENSTSQAISTVKILTEFINLLSRFAEDNGTFNAGGPPRLLFVLPPDGKAPQKTIVVPIKLESAVLINELKFLAVLDALTNINNEKKLHIEERKLLMRIAIGDVLSMAGDDVNLFTFLAKNWHDVLKKYFHNLKSYVHRFSFDDVRKKIADAEMEYVSKLSAVLNDISGKLIALPISLVALIALENAASNFSFLCGFVGLSIVSLVYILLLVNQELQVDRLKSSFDLVFSPFFIKIETYPTVLRLVLKERRSGFEVQLKRLRMTFKVFYVISFVPLAGAAYQAGSRYGMEVAGLLRYLNA